MSTTEAGQGPGMAGGATLFRSEALAARAHLGRGSPFCFVTFEPASEGTSLDRPAFGESYFAAHGVDCIHILCAVNNWYEEPEMADLLACVRQAVAAYPRVIAYGSSMGATAALRHGSAAGATAIIALSPRFSRKAARYRGPLRPEDFTDTPKWRDASAPTSLPDVPDTLVIYDDRVRDRWHGALIRRERPDATFVVMPYAGHPVTAFMAETGTLSSAILAIAHSKADPRAIRRAARAARARSGQYLYTLAQCQPLHRIRTKMRLAEKATEVVPGERVYLSYLGLVCEAAGDVERAAALHRQVQPGPLFAFAMLRYATFLWRAGQRDEAIGLVAEVCERKSLEFDPVEVQAAMLLTTDRVEEAREVLTAYRRRTHAPMFTFNAAWPILKHSSPAVRARWCGQLLNVPPERWPFLLPPTVADELKRDDAQI